MTVLFLVLYTLRVFLWPTALISRPTDRKIKRWCFQTWCRMTAVVVGLKIEASGPPPKPPFFLVANHLSYIDMLLIIGQTGAVFVSRGEVAHWPIIGPVMKSFYVLFVDRTNRRDTKRVNEEIHQTLQEGDGIAFFPESRIFCGQQVEPFKSALIQPALDNHLPVHYATITYQTPPGKPPAERIVGWWRPEPFFRHLFRFLRHSGYTARIQFGDTPLNAPGRKALAQKLHEAVNKNFTPVK